METILCSRYGTNGLSDKNYSESSFYQSGEEASVAFGKKGKDKGYWRSREKSGWVQIQFNEPKKIVKLYIKTVYWKERCGKNFVLKASNDKITWTDIIESTTIFEGEKYWEFRNDSKYLYYRIVFLDNWGCYEDCSVDIIDMYEEIKKYKYLLKQDSNYYTIKSDFYKNGNYKPITELEGKEILNQTDFQTFGIDDLNLLTKTIDTQVVKGIDKGNLGNGNLFEIPFNNDFMSISEVE